MGVLNHSGTSHIMCKNITLPLNIESPMRNRITYKQTRNPLGPVLNNVEELAFQSENIFNILFKTEGVANEPSDPSAISRSIMCFYSDSWTDILCPVHTRTLNL